MSIERARAHLQKHGLEDRIKEFTVSSATVALAAQALGCEPERIAKSLSFEKGDGAILVLAAGDARIDNRKYKEEFGTKAKMLTPEEVKELIGHEVGGVCPFAVNEGVKVCLDKSLKKYDTVYPACGSSNSAIPLTIAELEKCSGYTKWVDVSKETE